MASFDVIFVGGGPAGYVGAVRAAQLGLTVGVVEREGLGGTCVLWGCIPAKALLESAAVAHRAREAKAFGVNVGEITTDYSVAMKRSRAVSTQNSKGVEFLFKKNKITWIKGTGTITGKKTISVTDERGTATTHDAKKGIVICTGSRVKGIPAIGLTLDKENILSSDDVLILEKAPATMAIVGCGAVGCEFADVFNEFGTKVTMLETMPSMIPVEDADVAAELARSFKKRGIEVILNAKIESTKIGKGSVTLSLGGPEKKELTFEKVLVAAGRAPVIDGLGLEALGVKLTDRGFIKIDDQMRTSVEGIYAIGDVAGPPMLAHKGEREGIVAAEVIAGKNEHKVNYGNIPNATYCHPEVASIGLTEQQCKEQKLEYKVGRYNFSANGRARTSGETEGFVKIIRDTKYGEILGAHIIGAHATEMIHELAVARENEFTVEEIELAIHAHPTLSEAIAEAVLDSMGRALNA
jgi:dihydrolipoamide dehydrogenase